VRTVAIANAAFAPAIKPEFVIVARLATIPRTSPEIVPELTTDSVSVTEIACEPEIVPVFRILAVSLRVAIPVAPVATIAPEFAISASLASMPLASP